MTPPPYSSLVPTVSDTVLVDLLGVPGSSPEVIPVFRDPRFTKLRSIKVLKCLSDEQLLQWLPYVGEAHVDKDTVVFYERDLPEEVGNRLFLVVSGCIKLIKYSTEGESTIVRLASAGEFFGATSALSNKPYPFSAEAMVESELLIIDKDRFVALATQHPQVALNMVVELGEVLWFGYETHSQVVKKTESRVAKILLHHFQREGYETIGEGLLLNMHLPHDYLSSMTGIAYEESVRIISRLKKQHKCIQYLRGGRIVITNLPVLKEIAQVEDLG